MFAAATLALLWPFAGAVFDHLLGSVVGITEGDTLTVLVGRQPVKARLAEIDTPERGQPWASKAKQLWGLREAQRAPLREWRAAKRGRLGVARRASKVRAPTHSRR